MPTTSTLDDLLQQLWDAKGTDLLLTVGAPAMIRVDGELRPVEGEERLTDDAVRGLVATSLVDSQAQKLERS